MQMCEWPRVSIYSEASSYPSSSLASLILPEPRRPPPPPPPPPVVLNLELLLTGVLPCELVASDAPDWTCRISGAGGGTELSLSFEFEFDDDEGSGACTLDARVLLRLAVDRGTCPPGGGGGGDMGSTVDARERVVRRDDAPRAGVAGGGRGSREAFLEVPREEDFAAPRVAAAVTVDDPPSVDRASWRPPPLPTLSSSSSSSPSPWPGKAPGGNLTTRSVRSMSTLSSFGG